MTDAQTQPGSNEPSEADMLYQAARDWLAAKGIEAKATAKRVSIEGAMLGLDKELERHPKGDGSKTTTLDKPGSPSVSITVKDSISVKCSDRKRLHELCVANDIAPDDMPIKASYSVDTKKLAAIKKADPEAYTALCEVLESKPGKPGFTVKVTE